jgi:hypothetical protein
MQSTDSKYHWDMAAIAPAIALVTVPFSVFSAGPVQNMQFAFISNCRDETTTHHGAQRPFD